MPELPAKNPTELTLKQALFVQEYMANGGNATKAAIKAGYAESSAEVSASRLLSSDKIQARLTSLQKNRCLRLEADADWVIRNLIGVVKSAKKKKDFAGMNRALELIGKAQGMFTDSGKVTDTQVTVHLNMPAKEPINLDDLIELDPEEDNEEHD